MGSPGEDLCCRIELFPGVHLEEKWRHHEKIMELKNILKEITMRNGETWRHTCPKKQMRAGTKWRSRKNLCVKYLHIQFMSFPATFLDRVTNGTSTLWWFNIAMENHHFLWKNPLNMAMFNCYVCLPEGNHHDWCLLPPPVPWRPCWGSRPHIPAADAGDCDTAPTWGRHITRTSYTNQVENPYQSGLYV